MLADKEGALRDYKQIVVEIAAALKLPTQNEWDSKWSKLLIRVAQEVGQTTLSAHEVQLFMVWERDTLTGPSMRDNVFRQKRPGTPVHVRLGSIHSVKGETHTAALLCETFYKAHHLKSLKSWLLGKKSGGVSENSTTQARLKQHYVAMTRPTHLFCLAIRRDSLSEAEIDQLKSKWRLGLVTATEVSWL
jgi:DNA helicase-2/ATP-dependent DNA helicase PcrA